MSLTESKESLANGDMATKTPVQIISNKLQVKEDALIARRRGVWKQRKDLDHPVKLTNLSHFISRRKFNPAKAADASLSRTKWDRLKMATTTDKYYREVDPAQNALDVTRKRAELLEGDHKSFMEAAETERESNKKRIKKLRMDNERMRKDLAQKVRGDEHVVGNAFTEAGKMMPPHFRGAGCQAAVGELDRAISISKKKLDLLQYNNKQRMDKITELEELVELRRREYEEIKGQDEGGTEDARTLNNLENEMMLMEIRYQEGRHINTMYQKIVEKLSEDRLHYDRLLEAMAKACKEKEKATVDLLPVRSGAEAARDKMQLQLSMTEDQMITGRRVNERILRDYQKRSDKDKQPAEKSERKVQHHRMSLVDDTPQSEEKSSAPNKEQDSRMERAESTLKKIMDATGVTTTEGIEERLRTQIATHEALKASADKCTEKVERLKELKDRLTVVVEQQKYTGQTKVSRGQDMVEQFRENIVKVDADASELDIQARELNQTYTDISGGVENLSRKLALLKEPKLSVASRPVAMTRNDEILEALAASERKLTQLMDELQGRDMDILEKEMRDTQFNKVVIKKMPKINRRVKWDAPAPVKPTIVDDDSDADNEVAVTRDQLKKQAQQLRDLQNKKKKKKKEDGAS